MKHIHVTNIQRLCVSDGPGVRTVVFLKGCTLDCPWCCNPEAVYMQKDFVYDNDCCIKDVNSSICANCELKGGALSIAECPLKAYEKTSVEYTSRQLIDILQKDVESSNCSGITFSGGEPLIHSEALEEVLRFLKSQGMSIAFETTLYAPADQFDKCVIYADYWLVDLKMQHGFIQNTESKDYSRDFMRNLKVIQESLTDIVQYRMVYIKDLIQKVDTIIETLIDYNVSQIEILPLHNLAESKYKRLHKAFNRFQEPNLEEINKFCSILKNKGIQTNIES